MIKANDESKRRGNCYVTCEAIYHLIGGKSSGWCPTRISFQGDTHWFLRHKESGIILDPTAVQFGREQRSIPYKAGRGSGFLTKYPSNRAKELMERMVWQDGKA